VGAAQRHGPGGAALVEEGLARLERREREEREYPRVVEDGEGGYTPRDGDEPRVAAPGDPKPGPPSPWAAARRAGWPPSVTGA
jgi:hypothetical protein